MPRARSSDVLCNNDGEFWVDWLGNTVTIIGPAVDIDAFKALCIVPAGQGEEERARFELERVMPTPAYLTDDEDRLYWRNDNWGAAGEPWGMKIDPSNDAWTLSFFFQTGGGFPKPVFECLARSFPRLAFECFSLEISGQYMEIGWFNTPPGCSDFEEVDQEDVPQDCPFSGPPRDAVSELRHMRTILKIKEIAQRNDLV